MKKIGISIYPTKSGEDETIEYIKYAHKLGFSRIFANLLEVKNNDAGQNRLNMFKRIFKIAKDLGFEIIVDVDRDVYKQFNLNHIETKFFRNLNFTGIRLDQDFNGEVESEITHNNDGIKLEMNASGRMENIINTIKKGADVKSLMATYNFYPQKYTGQSVKNVVYNGTLIHNMGVRVGIFVTLPPNLKTWGPWEVNDGMPTLEKHRNVSLKEQVEELLMYPFIDDIILSQQANDLKHLEEMSNVFKLYEKFNSEKLVKVSIDESIDISQDEKDILYKPLDYSSNKVDGYIERKDSTPSFIRISMPRVSYSTKELLPKNSGKKLKKGDIVILNKNMKRYKGEINIILEDIDDSKTNWRNLVGKVDKNDFDKIFLLENPKMIMFRKSEENHEK